jgi:prepilin-type N-terminal cleavage/methylation domain-containing protein
MRRDGFSLVELLVAMVMLSVMITIAIPVFGRWLPDYRLRRASRDLYSNMQLAKMGAVRSNANWAIVFDVGGNRYFICSDDGANNTWDGPAAMGGDDVSVGGAATDSTSDNAVNLGGYESGVAYGHGNATTNATVGGGAFPAGDVSYNNNVAIFNTRGTGTGGYVYLENDKGTTTYAIGTRTSGVIRLLEWDSATNDWG